MIPPGWMCSCPHTVRSSRNVLTRGDIVPPELVGAMELEVLPRLTWPTATFWIAPSHPCQGPSWCSGIQDEGRISTRAYCEPKGLFCLPASPHWSTVCPGQAGTPFLGTHRLSFGFQRKWQLIVITSPPAPFSSFRLLNPQVTAGY